MRVLLTCLLALATTACSSLSTSFDYDMGADFASLHAYAWLEDPGQTEATSLALQRAHAAVDEQLAARGYRLDPQAPDFLVAVHVTKAERVQVTDWGYSYGHYGGWYATRGPDLTTYEEGSLILDVVGAAKRALMWRGTASRIIDDDWTPEEREQAVREAVAALLERFPPGHGG